MNFDKWLSIIAALIAFASLIDRYLQRKNESTTKLREAFEKSVMALKDELREACIDIAILKKQMGVFWNVIETNAGKMLHAPTHHRRDELIERLVGERPPPLSIEEVDELSCEMQAIIDAPNERIPGERMYAILMRGRLEAKKAKHELLETTKVKTINQC